MQQIFAPLLLAIALSAATADPSFVVYSPAISLRVSEIHNRPTSPVALPQHLVDEFAAGDTQMLITNYSFDIVTLTDGVETSVPLYDVYNHHYILYMGSAESMEEIHDHMRTHDPVDGGECWHEWHGNGTDSPSCRLDMMGSAPSCLAQLQRTSKAAQAASFGGAAGGEMRHNPALYPAPYGVPVPQPEQMMPVLHLINTQNSSTSGSASPWLQCPCTDERVIDYTNGTIDGCVPSPAFRCNDWFNASLNPGCFLDEYTSGYRCCKDGVFLNGHTTEGERQPPSITVYAKMTFHHHAIPTGPSHVQLHKITLDVTGDYELNVTTNNVEYTVPACPEGTPAAQCQHVVSTVQRPVSDWIDHLKCDYVELVHAVGHVHSGAKQLQLVDNQSGQLLCDAGLTYGASRAAGDKAGYLVGIQPCVFQPPLKLYRETELRVTATYNNTVRIDGVMSLYFLQVSVPDSCYS